MLTCEIINGSKNNVTSISTCSITHGQTKKRIALQTKRTHDRITHTVTHTHTHRYGRKQQIKETIGCTGRQATYNFLRRISKTFLKRRNRSREIDDAVGVQVQSERCFTVCKYTVATYEDMSVTPKKRATSLCQVITAIG